MDHRKIPMDHRKRGTNVMPQAPPTVSPEPRVWNRGDAALTNAKVDVSELWLTQEELQAFLCQIAA